MTVAVHKLLERLLVSERERIADYLMFRTRDDSCGEAVAQLAAEIRAGRTVVDAAAEELPE